MYEQDKINGQNLSIPKIIFLGIFPGLVICLITIVFSSPFFGINISVILSLMVAIILGLIPVELGVLKFIAWKENKKIKDLILYRNKTPAKKLIVSIIIPFVITGASFGFISIFEDKLWVFLKIFDFIPDWFRLDKMNFAEIKYLKLTMVLVFIFNGFLGPIVEEIYFRGYLLPRMNVFGKFAPLVNMIIFSIYHFHTPWQNITRIIGITPMVYSVWINKDLKIGIIVHCLCNVMGNIGMLALILM